MLALSLCLVLAAAPGSAVLADPDARVEAPLDAAIAAEATPRERGFAAASAGLGAAAGHLAGLSASLGLYAALATAGVHPLLALSPLLALPPALSAAGAGMASAPFSSAEGALVVGATGLVVNGVATGGSALVFLVVLWDSDPGLGVDAAIVTLVAAPALAAALGAGAAAALVAAPAPAE